MKKIYNAPTLKVINVKVSKHLMTGSDPQEATLDPTTSGEIESSDGIGARSSVWDDEEDY